MIVINFEDLTLEFLKSIKNEIVQINYNNESFYFKMSIKEESDRLVVHTNGAINWDKHTPPVHMRSSWGKEINAHCLFIDDKTIHKSGINTGWGAGIKERFYIEDYSVISKRIKELLKIDDSKTFYWGSSAGGFVSIILAVMDQNTIAVVNNPQTNLTTHRAGKTSPMYKAVFPGMNQEQIMDEYPERLSVVSAIKKYNNIPELYYFQNNQYEFDLKNHYNQFRNDIKKFGLSENKFMYFLYNDYELGHSPLPKDKTLEYLETVMSLHDLRTTKIIKK